jgi:hypothetical protein
MNTDERKAARARYWTGVDQLHVAEIAGDCHLMAGYPFGDTVAVFQGDEAEAYANLCAGAVHDLPAALDELDVKDVEIARLRGALEEDVAECAAWCDVDLGCSVCRRSALCKKRAALQALREGGEGA